MDNSTKNSQTIVTMSDYQPHSGYTPLSLVEAYWDALRAGREMPKRAEIDPRGIESALEHAFILERVAPGVARLRIAGTHLHDVMGMEARGMPITAFFERDDRIRIAGLLEEVFQTPALAELHMTSKASLGKPALEARMILLPLKSDLGDVSRIFGCMVVLGEMGTVPRRFDLSNVDVRRLGNGLASVKQPSVKQTPAEQTPAKQASVVQIPVEQETKEITQGFAEPEAAFKPPEAPTPSEVKEKGRPPYLRLVVPEE